MSGRPLILLVDDNRDDVAIAMRAFRRADLDAEVRTVRTGEEALEALQANGTVAPRDAMHPAVIFLDLRMPQPDGFEVLRRLRRVEHTRAIPIVVVSSSAHPDDIQRCYELGANSYLVKRFEARDPGAYLAEAARYWVELNQVTRQE